MRRTRWGWLILGPVALLSWGLMGVSGPELTGQAATERATAKPVIFEGHQGEAAVKIQDKVLTIGPGEMTKGKGWVWEPYRNKINAVELDGNVRVVGDASGMFKDLKRGGKLKLQGLDVSQATSLADCFKNLNMESLDLYGWQTGEVTDFSGMFTGAKLRTFPRWVDAFDTTQATTMANMFRGVEILKADVLDFNDWQTQNVTNMRGMFADSYGLGILEMQDWDMRHVTDCREFATWNTPDERRIQGFTFGPNVRFDGAMGTTVLPVSRGYSHKWHQLEPQDSGEFRDCEISYSASALQKRYTGQAPLGTQIYAMDFFSARVSGHDEKVYDGEPAELDAEKYQVKLAYDPQFVTGLHSVFEPRDNELAFGRDGGAAPTEPGTYPVTLNDTGVNTILDMLEPFEDNSETYRAGVNPLFFGTYTILPADTPEKLGKVQVTYQTTDGQMLKKMTLTGKVGSDYAISREAFTGYRFQEIQGKATGKFTADDQTVTYLYAVDENDETSEIPQPEQPGSEAPLTPDPGTEPPTDPDQGSEAGDHKPTSPGHPEPPVKPGDGPSEPATPETPSEPDQDHQLGTPAPTPSENTSSISPGDQPQAPATPQQPTDTAQSQPLPGTGQIACSNTVHRPQTPVGSPSTPLAHAQKPDLVQALRPAFSPASQSASRPTGTPLTSGVSAPNRLGQGLSTALTLPQTTKPAAQSALPQTGQRTEVGLVWLGIGGLVGLLGWGVVRRRNLKR